MRALLALLVLRHARERPLRLALALACVALGVALFVALEASHATVAAAARARRGALVGEARWQVRRGRGLGVDVDAARRLEARLAVVAAPVLEAEFLTGDGRPLRLRGVDPERELRLRPGAMSGPEFVSASHLAAPALASWLDGRPPALVNSALPHSPGELLPIDTPRGPREARVVATLARTGLEGGLEEALGPLAVVPLPALQAWTGRTGEADRLEVGGAAGEEELARVLGPGYRIEPAGSGGSRVLDQILANLEALVLLSAIGLLAGMFVVFQVVSVSVVERAPAVGTARALGATRGQVAGAFLVEGAALGLCGSLLGLVAGLGLARAALGLVDGLANLYVHSVALGGVHLPGTTALLALVLGTGTSVAAALAPALRAAGVSPARALRPGRGAGSLHSAPRAVTVLGLTCTALALLGSLVPPWPRQALLAGYAPALVLFLGAALTLPALLGLGLRLVGPLVLGLGSLPLRLAVDGLAREPSRAGLTAVALAGALGLHVTASTQLLSARTAIDAWVRSAFPADLSVAPRRAGGLYGDLGLDGELEARLRADPAVERGYAARLRIQELGEDDVLVQALDLAACEDLLRERGEELLGGVEGEARRALLAGEALAVSRNLVARRGAAAARSLALPTPTGTLELPVVHVVDDFSWPQGAVFLDLELYRARWRDHDLGQFHLLLAPGSDPAAVRARLSRLPGVELTGGEELRRIAAWAVDQAYGLVRAQVLVALLVGALGTVATLSISVLQRRRELGLLRIVGLERRQLARVVQLEALLLALLGAGVGTAAGLFCAAFPAARLLELVAGYVVPLRVPVGAIAAVVLAAAVVGWLASLLPCRQALETDPLRAIAEE